MTGSSKHVKKQRQHPTRQGDWVHPDKEHHQDWLDKTIEHVNNKPKEEKEDLIPILREFKETVDKSSRLTMLFDEMWTQIPNTTQFQNDPVGAPNIKDFNHFLQILDHILTTAPAWTDNGHEVGMVGVPIYVILQWPMATRAGHAAFLDPEVNRMMKKVLDVWGKHLQSPESAVVLGTGKEGWFGETGLKALTEVANNGKTNFTFEEMFECKPKQKYHGYTSWDDFFTRLFKFDDDRIRPIAGPDDDDVVINVAESKPYKVAHDIERRAKFWIKGQPYSVMDMLAHDPLGEKFVGGTVYQAFLSALSYHRWNSPVTGTVTKTELVPGCYFAEPNFEDFSVSEEDAKGGETMSQEYLSSMNTRAIMYIEADNPKIGLMAVIAIGMDEVSSCEVYPKPGDRIKKGDLLGSFHFGGSTHCVLFRKGIKVTGFPEIGGEHNVPVRSQLCRVE